MSFYNEAIEFFVEHGIQLDEEQLEALRESKHGSAYNRVNELLVNKAEETEKKLNKARNSNLSPERFKNYGDKIIKDYIDYASKLKGNKSKGTRLPCDIGSLVNYQNPITKKLMRNGTDDKLIRQDKKDFLDHINSKYPSKGHEHWNKHYTSDFR